MQVEYALKKPVMLEPDVGRLMVTDGDFSGSIYGSYF